MSFTPNKIDRENFELFTDGPIFYFRIIGIKYGSKITLLSKVIMVGGVISLLHLIIYLLNTTDDSANRSMVASYANYWCISLSRIISILYNRPHLQENHENLKKAYPKKHIERAYGVEHYLKTYKWVEFFLANFFMYFVILFHSMNLGQAFYELAISGEYNYKTLLNGWYPVPLDRYIIIYMFYYVYEAVIAVLLVMCILASDLCLYSSVAQLCLHFDMITQDILEINPEEIQSLYQLKDIVRRHQIVLKLSEKINKIFSTSILFSLISSAFILCFEAHELLGDVSIVYLIKSLLLFFYEMKEVIITCYYGNKLIDSSSNIFTATYMHNWYSSPTIEYKKLVLFMLTNTRKPVALIISGGGEVSLQTLKRVFNFSYQMLAVLKNT